MLRVLDLRQSERHRGGIRRRYRKPDLEKARALVRELGYDGRPVVLIGGSDVLPYQRMSLITADLLKRIGMNVDMQLSDWGSVAARRAKKDPPSQGGWNLFHTSANGAQLASPLTSPSTITTCDGKNFQAGRATRSRKTCGCVYPRNGSSEAEGAAGVDA